IVISREDYIDIAGVDYVDFEKRYDKIYDGQSLNTNYFKIPKIPSSLQLTVTIESYKTYYETSMTVQEILRAGTYKLNLSVTDSTGNYDIQFKLKANSNDIYNILDFQLMRCPAVITAYANNVNYKESINVVYTFLKLSDQTTIEDETYNSASVSYQTQYAPGSKPGSYTIKAVAVAGERFAVNYAFNSGESTTFTVSKIDIPNMSSVSFADLTVQYNNTAYSIVPTNLPEGNFNIEYEKTTYKNVGEYTYTLTIESDDTGYKIYTRTAKLTITTANLTVEVNSISIYYSNIPIFSVSYSAPGFDDTPYGIDTTKVFNYTCQYTGTQIPQDYQVTVSSDSQTVQFLTTTDANNYNKTVTFVAGTLTVLKTTRNVLLTNNSVIYTGEVFAPKITIGGVSVSVFDGITLSYLDSQNQPIAAPIDVGSYTIKLDCSQNDYYIAEEIIRNFNITRATLQLQPYFIVIPSAATTIDITSDGVSVAYTATKYSIDLSITLKSSLNAALKTNNDIFWLSYSAKQNDTTIQGDATYTKTTGFPGTPLVTSSAGAISNIQVLLTSKNYNPITLVAPGIVTIAKGDLKLDTTPTEYVYTTLAIYPIIKFEPQFDIIYPDTAQDVYTITLSKNGFPVNNIITAGQYEITLTLKSSNYKFATGTLNKLNITVDKFTAKVDLSEVPQYVRTYGDSQAISYEIEYDIGELPFKETISFITTGALSYLAPGTYDILGVTEKENVKYDIINGSNKIKINPLTLTFDWAHSSLSTTFHSTLTYTGNILYDKEVAIAEAYWTTTNQRPSSGALVNARATFTTSVKNVGVYTATLVVNSTYYSVSEESLTFDITIQKAPAKLLLYDINIQYGNPLPAIRGALDPQLDDDGETAYQIEPSMDAYYSANGIPGTYTILANATSTNYQITVVQATLTVSLATFTGVSFPNATVPFTLSNFKPILYGLPENTNISKTEVLDVGIHEIKITIEKQYFAPLELSAMITVTQNTIDSVVLATGTRLPFVSDVSQTDFPTPNGEALFENVSVPGTFVYEGTPTRKFGISSYGVTFIPTSSNLATVINLYYEIEFYATPEDVILNLIGIDEIASNGDYILTDSSTTLRFFFSTNSAAYRDIVVYLNDAIIGQNAIYEITEPGDYTIMTKLDDTIITSKSITVRRQNNTDDSDPDDEDTDDNPSNETNTSTPNNKPKTGEIFLYIGIGVGSLGIVIVIFILIKKRTAQHDKSKRK
ncbi:MAG: hypothetical protein LBE09_07860, partial [Christensenellaceae bacterium]|nr:hypothetical protein [Christensenellaceae bacterium]